MTVSTVHHHVDMYLILALQGQNQKSLENFALSGTSPSVVEQCQH
jgi:hypothetical protein